MEAAKRKKPKATPRSTTRKVPEDHNPHAPRGIVSWVDAPRMFDGKVVAIIGGGPSLKGYDLSFLAPLVGQNLIGCIAVNTSYKIAPFANILHFADCEWWRWNGEHVMRTWPTDKIITTATSDVTHVNSPRIKRFWRDRNKFSDERAKLHGWDSGTQAVNLAYHLGAKKIVLFGIDMQPAPDGETQWHREHKRVTYVPNYATKFAPSLAESVRQLAKRGVTVVRATEPGIPEARLEAVEQALVLP